jgi:uncharacterized membrane protein (UPF0127 family)
MSDDDGIDEPAALNGLHLRSRRLPRQIRVIAADGVVVCTRCDVADRPFTRMRGLLGRSSIAPGEGMLFTRGSSIMTFFMRFPIDVVFLDKAQTIVKITHSLVPWRTTSARKAFATLELPAGTAVSLGLEPGTALVFADATAR